MSMTTSLPEETPMEDDPVMQTDSPLTEPAFRERLRDLPPSAKLVARTIHDDAPLSRVEIMERSLLHARTLQGALTNLEEAGPVEASQSALDGNREVYHLTSPAT